jgi:hypothetical protein
MHALVRVQWNEVLLANLSQVTAACLNALLLAMLDRTQTSQQQPPSHQMPLSLATPPPPPQSYYDNKYAQPMHSAMPPLPQPPQVDLGTAEMVQILKV